MSFDTPAGTRGARQPSGPLFRLVNKLMAGRIRRSGRFRGSNALILTTVGRKTGQERSTPVNWFPGPDGSRLIVASAAGAAGNPGWYYNIAANPDKVRIEVEGRTVAVDAEQLHDAERERAWEQIVSASPGFADYEKKTDRELPVIRLTERN
ncbi:nitroreductase/quinone reductase family protein [Rhodococcus zopfii]|uniref:nitroreductase/quinone reductase family protein n=1 Tax=unclassified Rhodococcus (in: high G+C Gram-positive bacteria) TaxID=192944 RepID=UPI0018CF7D1C|nr:MULTISPECIES: nitroreductase/quinone reductase family protein [unclassified Rhodococcus (in: high G+C Gram-positive bacteria)]MBH0123750.1 nitroreductase family deazaflavin-dependent oxidoreductase [Rhodococcus sp. CX]MCK8671177.1 nitroreductase family deazaflavin-dependent oxidoreductase [Rhodococcus sp. HM1]